ncbi:hypothetical protein [Flavobacterium gelidilacus]|uniref:hypothetical protein n=1 Tax=Flavobacterium gelidilacus TaxID=206041 RepID=UPI0004011F27|nr:hypothetical protein [Flavobacterium gelidilacus]
MKEERRKVSFREELTISKFRFWLGLFVSVLLSFSIYIFSVSLRDYLRLLTFTQNFNYLEFTKNELLFYNLFYAFLALLIGQTFFFKIVFDTNRKYNEKTIQFKRKKIVHNQNVLIWVFLYWFFKFSVMYGMFNISSFGLRKNFNLGIHYQIDFYKEYDYFFFLIILVLFLQSWQSMRCFTRNYFKYILLSFGLISLIAFLFSQINILSFESKFSEIKKNNLYTKHQIDLPKSEYLEKLFYNSITKQFYISNDSQIYYQDKNESIKIKNLISYITENDFLKYHRNEHIQLNIDKKTPIKFVNKIKKTIYILTDYEIAYSTYPTKFEHRKSFYQDNSFGISDGKKYLSKNKSNRNFYLNYENRIDLKQNSKNEISVDNKFYNKTTLIEYIKDRILENEKYIITIDLKENAVFNDYIQLLSIAKEGYFKACEIKAKKEDLELYNLEYNIDDIIKFNVIDLNALSYERNVNITEMIHILNNAQ